LLYEEMREYYAKEGGREKRKNSPNRHQRRFHDKGAHDPEMLIEKAPFRGSVREKVKREEIEGQLLFVSTREKTKDPLPQDNQ